MRAILQHYFGVGTANVDVDGNNNIVFTCPLTDWDARTPSGFAEDPSKITPPAVAPEE
jgi:hypothetical protein